MRAQQSGVVYYAMETAKYIYNYCDLCENALDFVFCADCNGSIMFGIVTEDRPGEHYIETLICDGQGRPSGMRSWPIRC
jgi:hypothetical protein